MQYKNSCKESVSPAKDILLGDNTMEKEKLFPLLNLNPIKVKLMDREEGEGWDRETVDRVEIMYRRFLYLVSISADDSLPICPNREVDKFWHQHILDTQKYADDCQQFFGRFLHHFPYFGMRGDDDVATLSEAFKATCRLYEETFGEPYVDQTESAQRCDVTCRSNCQVTCSNRISFEERPRLREVS